MQSADGRSVVTLHDNGGEPYQWVSNAVPVISAVFVPLINIPLTKDPQTNRPSMVRGQIVVTATLSFDDSVLQFVFDEIVVTGFVGSSGTVLYRTTLSTQDPIARVTFDSRDTFDKITIDARLNVNGNPTDLRHLGSPQSILQNTITAVAYMWTS